MNSWTADTGNNVCLLGLFIADPCGMVPRVTHRSHPYTPTAAARTNFASVLLWATPAEHVYRSLRNTSARTSAATGMDAGAVASETCGEATRTAMDTTPHSPMAPCTSRLSHIHTPQSCQQWLSGGMTSHSGTCPSQIRCEAALQPPPSLCGAPLQLAGPAAFCLAVLQQHHSDLQGQRHHHHHHHHW